jgi:predicted oxidoreductase
LPSIELRHRLIISQEIFGLSEVEWALGAALALSPSLRDKLEMFTNAGVYMPCSYHPDCRTAHYDATGARLT